MADQLIIEFHEQSCFFFCFAEEKKGQAYCLKKVLPVELPFAAATADLEVSEQPSADPEASGDEPRGGGAASIDANGKAIRKALDEAEISVDSAIVVVPKQWATLRMVRLPASEPSEIPDMARFEAERHIPFNAERHIVDYYALSIDEIEGARLLLAAIDGPPSDRISDTIKSAGLKLQAMDITTLGMVNVLRRLYPPQEGVSLVQVHAGLDTTDIAILLSGDPIFVRSVPFGAQKLSETDAGGEGPDPVQRLIREIRRTLDYAQREFDCPPLSSAFISGPAAVCASASASIEKQLGLDCNILEISEDLAVDDSIRIRIASELPCSDSELIPACGALLGALNTADLHVNLIPSSYRLVEERKKRRKQIVTATIAAAATLLLVFLITFLLLQTKKHTLAQLERQIAQDEEQVEKIMDMQSVVRIISRNSRPQGSALAILDTMSGWKDMFGRENMRVALVDFLFEGDKSLRISGYAQTYADFNSLIGRLKNCGHFRYIDAQEHKPTNDRNISHKRVIRYAATCYLLKDKD